MPIPTLLFQDSRAILYLLEFAKGDVISSQPHSKLRLQTHVEPFDTVFRWIIACQNIITLQFYTQVKAEEFTQPVFLQRCVQFH